MGPTGAGRVPSRGKSKYKGSEAGACLEGLKKGEGTRVGGVGPGWGIPIVQGLLGGRNLGFALNEVGNLL